MGEPRLHLEQWTNILSFYYSYVFTNIIWSPIPPRYEWQVYYCLANGFKTPIQILITSLESTTFLFPTSALTTGLAWNSENMPLSDAARLLLSLVSIAAPAPITHCRCHFRRMQCCMQGPGPTMRRTRLFNTNHHCPPVRTGRSSKNNNNCKARLNQENSSRLQQCNDGAIGDAGEGYHNWTSWYEDLIAYFIVSVIGVELPQMTLSNLGLSDKLWFAPKR